MTLVMMFAVRIAGADDGVNPEAKKLFDEGRALVDQGKQPEACELFQKSYEIERAAGTMLNLGECAEREGKHRRAWLMYDAAAQEYDKRQLPGRAKFARDRADALASKLATVVVRLAEPRLDGLTVRIGDRAAPPAAEIIERLDAGAVTIVVNATGRKPFTTTANATGGKQVVVRVPALEVVAAAVIGNDPRPIETPRDSRRKRSRVLLAAGIGGAGVLGVAISGFVGLSAKSDYNQPFDAGECAINPASKQVECNSEAAKQKVLDAGSKADVATGIAIVGGVLLAAGAVVYFTAPRESVTIAPMATTSSVGVAVSGRF